MDGQININYHKFESISALPQSLQRLAESAKHAYQQSYAPYSKFNVGAALLLENNQIVLGANQENASFSLTICAERTALGVASMEYPNTSIKCIAIAYNTEPIKDIAAILSPCGACRQHILEYQNRQTEPIQILMLAPDSSSILVNSIHNLLPFAFTGDSLPL